MAEVKVSIGGREFEVACRDGEEHYLHSAAALLDNEADALNEALGRMPETRMLLMAGLMLADKTASLEDQLKEAPGGGIAVDEGAIKRARKIEAHLSDVQTELAEVKAELAEVQAKAEEMAAKEDDAAAIIKELEAKAEAAAKTAAAKAAEVEDANAIRDAAVQTMQNMVKRVEEAAENLRKAN